MNTLWLRVKLCTSVHCVPAVQSEVGKTSSSGLVLGRNGDHGSRHSPGIHQPRRCPGQRSDEAWEAGQAHLH